MGCTDFATASWAAVELAAVTSTRLPSLFDIALGFRDNLYNQDKKSHVLQLLTSLPSLQGQLNRSMAGAGVDIRCCLPHHAIVFVLDHIDTSGVGRYETMSIVPCGRFMIGRGGWQSKLSARVVTRAIKKHLAV